MTGRGAWPANGAGGTKKYKDATKPGPYYYLGAGEASTDDPNGFAVKQAVKAYQRALRRRQGNKNIVVDGIFGKQTSRAVTHFQEKHPEVGTPWGGIGPETSKALLYPDMLAVVKKRNFKYPNLVSGTINSESFWDAGAVGYIDETDLGLAQINGPSHPDLSDRERLRPNVAFNFIIDYYNNAFSQLGNDLDLVVASYNLGIGGARTWDRAGRPDLYTPPGSTRERNMRRYIDNILAG